MSIASNPEKTILVLDDEPGFNTLLQELFKSTPHEVLAEQDPLSALSLLKRKRIDLVVTDQKMPGLTGAEFIRQARTNRPDLRFIMISGQLDGVIAREMIDEGIGGIFMKPVDIRALLNCAISLLDADPSAAGRSSADLAAFN